VDLGTGEARDLLNEDASGLSRSDRGQSSYAITQLDGFLGEKAQGYLHTGARSVPP